MKKYIQKILRLRKNDSGGGAKSTEEKGIALLMTLGMLAMLLIIGLGFASNATMNAKGTSVAIDKTNAEFLLQAAMARVECLADAGTHEIVSHGYRDRMNFAQRDWIYRIGDRQNREMKKPFEKIFSSSGDAIYRDLTWEYITGPFRAKHSCPTTAAQRYATMDKRTDRVHKNAKKNHYTSTLEQDDEEIYGRIAYWLAPSNALDPAALVSKDVDESKMDEIRYGQRVSEINIWALNDKSGNPDTAYDQILGNKATSGSVNVGEFNYNNCSAGGGGKLDSSWVKAKPSGYDYNYIPFPCGYGWATDKKNDSIFTQLFKSISVPDEDPFRHWFAEKPTPTQEKYWLDYDLNGEFKKEEVFHRFNICRTDWDSLTAEDIMGETLTPKTVKGVDVYYPTKIYPKPLTDGENNIAVEDGEIIPWLANWRERGTFPTGRAKGYQIAANLVDYCDTDDEPTSNIAPSSWDENHVPTYTGNEMTYYINEVYLENEFTITEETDLSNPTRKRNVYSVDSVLYIELANVYRDLAFPLFNPYQVYVDGVLTVVYADEAGGDHEIKIDEHHKKMGNFPMSPGQDYVTYSASLPLDYTTGYSTSLAAPMVKSVKLEVRNLWIAKYDFCSFRQYDETGKMSKSSKIGDLDTSGTINAPGTFYAQLDLSIKDPRQNLHYDDWEDFEMKTGGSLDPDIGTPSANNKIKGVDVNPSASGRDKETTTVLVDHGAGLYISTAYIRDKPMVSPWELGFIHRAASFETINIHEYNAYEDVAKDGGTLGGSYYTDEDDKNEKDAKGSNGGDANLFNQIKTESLIQTPMKVSFACDDKTDIFYALLYNVEIGSDPEDFTPLSGSAQRIKGAGAVKAAAGIADVGSSLTSRAAAAGIESLRDGSCGFSQDTDATQEELIGKIINLTSVDSAEGGAATSNIKAIVLVQVIKDLGGYVTDKPTQPDNESTYLREEIRFLKDIDADGDLDGKIDERKDGFDLDGLNYVFKGGITYDGIDKLGLSEKKTLVGPYENIKSDYADDTNVMKSVKLDPTDPQNKEKIMATVGRYDKYVDQISYEMKALIELKWDTVTSKYKIVRYELLGDD